MIKTQFARVETFKNKGIAAAGCGAAGVRQEGLETVDHLLQPQVSGGSESWWIPSPRRRCSISLQWRSWETPPTTSRRCTSTRWLAWRTRTRPVPKYTGSSSWGGSVATSTRKAPFHPLPGGPRRRADQAQVQRRDPEPSPHTCSFPGEQL